MPKDLFQPNASTSTAIAVFETYVSHNFDKDVVFYDLQDDGFILSKNKGRTDIYNKWNFIESELLDEILNGSKSDDIVISRVRIKKNDEWNIYAHSQPDYSKLNSQDFCNTINNYVIYQSKKELGLLEEDKTEFEMINVLSSYILEKNKINPKYQCKANLELFDKNRKWEYFKISDVFDRIEPTRGTTTYDLTEGNEIPYIAAKKKNNGFDYFVSEDGNEEYISDGNGIGIGIVFINLGDGSGGYSVYQAERFIGMNGKTSVGYSDYLNQYNALFLITILDKQRYKYSFGRSWTGQRFDQTKLYLPCKDNGSIDWEFMEDYIRSLPNGNII